MSRYDLVNEGMRANRRPPGDPITLLALFVVAPLARPEEYAKRLRDVISGGVRIAQSADFDQESISVQDLPSWFLVLTDGEDSIRDGDPLGSRGKRGYLEFRKGRSWEAEEWIYCFDPDLRPWSWWDVTIGPEGRVNVWVDTKGEAHVPCEELWWALFVAGAQEVDFLNLENAEVWEKQVSLAVGQ